MRIHNGAEKYGRKMGLEHFSYWGFTLLFKITNPWGKDGGLTNSTLNTAIWGGEIPFHLSSQRKYIRVSPKRTKDLQWERGISRSPQTAAAAVRPGQEIPSRKFMGRNDGIKERATLTLTTF